MKKAIGADAQMLAREIAEFVLGHLTIQVTEVRVLRSERAHPGTLELRQRREHRAQLPAERHALLAEDGLEVDQIAREPVLGVLTRHRSVLTF